MVLALDKSRYLSDTDAKDHEGEEMKLKKTMLFFAAISVYLAASSIALAGSLWWQILEDGCSGIAGADTCEVTLYWNSSKADKYDMWMVCWKEKRSGGNTCSNNQTTFSVDNDPAVRISGLKMEHKKKYKVKLYGRKKKNGKWRQAGAFPSVCVEVYQNRYNSSLWGVWFC